MKKGATRKNAISEAFVERVCKRLEENKRVRLRLPVDGHVNIDRQLPFLCVYRKPRKRADTGTERLVTGEASFLVVLGRSRSRGSHTSLVRSIVATLAPGFGAFLLIEIWSGRDEPVQGDADSIGLRPGFVIHSPRTQGLEPTLEELRRTLARIAVQKQTADVQIIHGGKCSPPGLGELLTKSELKELGCYVIGIEVRPIYRAPGGDEVHPLVLRKLEHRISRALKRAVYEFSHSLTTHTPEHYQALGRDAMRKVVWDIDRQLAKISNSFDFLLTVTPVNTSSAWSAFKRSHCSQAPEFLYRPVPIEPELAKRQLYNIPIERIEDPVIAHLFRDKQVELDRLITMLSDRRRSQFLYGSLQVFGGVNDKMFRLATDLLEILPPHGHEASAGPTLTAHAFAERAAAEVEYYREALPDLSAKVEVREDTIGLMVSRGNLLIGQQTKVPESRTEALIQHEIGTHMLTYYNGRAQPFRQLYAGLPGYEELQEGLAVLAEYLVGGLSKPRLRLLAGRVIAVRSLTDGASFIDTFRELHEAWGFSQYTAFAITTRVYRGGGLTKDAVYLRGLVRLLEYIGKGEKIDPLLVGKISLEHVPIIKEFFWRGVLRPVRLRPRYLNDPEAIDRLTWLGKGRSVLDLIERKDHETRIRRQRRQDGRTRLHDDALGHGGNQQRP
jgi:uncharacterized protein (TIGR02421 family)